MSSNDGGSNMTNAFFNERGLALERKFHVYSDMHPMHVHKSGGKIFVGNQTASANLPMLQSHGITHVVNATGKGFGSLPCHFEGQLSYFLWPISEFRTRIGSGTPQEVWAFVQPLWDFIDSALNEGKSVLVHCLAGAHRAGTTAIISLIHYEKLDPAQAIAEAKKRRPAVDPICDFPRFIAAVHHAEQQMRK